MSTISPEKKISSVINFNELEFKKMHEHQKNSFYWNLKKKIISDLWLQYYKNTFKVLDYGCGTGFLFIDSINEGTDIEFIDGLNIAEMYIKQNFPNAKFKHGMIDDVQEKFDIIFLLDVLEHINDEEIFLNKIVKLLNPNGTLIVTVPAHKWLFSDADTKSGHCRRYSMKELNFVVTKYGRLKLEKNYSFIVLMLPLLIFSRIIAKLNTYKIEQENNKILNKIFIKLIPIEYFVTKFLNIKFGASLVGIYKKYD
jgi:SAM-dependent methyltransferase